MFCLNLISFSFHEHFARQPTDTYWREINWYYVAYDPYEVAGAHNRNKGWHDSKRQSQRFWASNNHCFVMFSNKMPPLFLKMTGTPVTIVRAPPFLRCKKNKQTNSSTCCLVYKRMSKNENLHVYSSDECIEREIEFKTSAWATMIDAFLWT